MLPPVPVKPKIYHIVHMDRLSSIVNCGGLFCDAKMRQKNFNGTSIGLQNIKDRRLQKSLSSHPGLKVGCCVPFYFCPRSIMLYMYYKSNHPTLAYRGGQEPIVHLEADLHATVEWAKRNRQRWAFTLQNAGSSYFEDRCDLQHLDQINWDAIYTKQWSGCKESKQAEFLVEDFVSWELIDRVGVYSYKECRYVTAALQNASHHQPCVKVMSDWYY